MEIARCRTVGVLSGMEHETLSQTDVGPPKVSGPVYLVAGHTTRDLTESAWRVGGSVAYASLAARRLAKVTRVVTAYGADMECPTVFGSVESLVLPVAVTTSFRNRETKAGRTQELIAGGSRLAHQELPEDWRSPDILHIAPVYREIDTAFVAGFSPRITGATLQGWMRAVDEKGRIVRALVPQWEELLEAVDVAIFSREDIKYHFKWRRQIVDLVDLCVETRGPAGCVIVESEREYSVPTVPRKVSDTTGAGDLFAAAFLLEYYNSGDALRSARFANGIAGEMLTDSRLRNDLSVPSGSSSQK